MNQQRTGAMDCGLRRLATADTADTELKSRGWPSSLIYAMRFSVSAVSAVAKPCRNPQSIAPLTGAGLASFNSECSSNRERREKYETNVAKG